MVFSSSSSLLRCCWPSCHFLPALFTAGMLVGHCIIHAADVTSAQDIESTKREIQDQLKVLREDIDTHMFEYRANRKLSLQLRDMVAEGKLEEAQTMAEQQVEAHLGKIFTDKAYRKVCVVDMFWCCRTCHFGPVAVHIDFAVSQSFVRHSCCYLGLCLHM